MFRFRYKYNKKKDVVKKNDKKNDVIDFDELLVFLQVNIPTITINQFLELTLAQVNEYINTLNKVKGFSKEEEEEKPKSINNKEKMKELFNF